MKRIAAVAITILLGFSLAYAQENEVQPVSNTGQTITNTIARLSYIKGNSFVQRAQDLGYEEGELNTPLAEGDRIGTTDGWIEIFLGKGNYLRLDQDTKIDLVTLPRRDNGLIRIRQWSGHLYLDVGNLAREKSIEILTDDATFYVLDKGIYRIDVLEKGGTEILAFQGMLEAAGEEGSILVKGSQRLTLADGRFEGKPAAFFAAGSEDDFDRFNGERNAIVRRQIARRYLNEDLGDLEYELDEYGDWMESPEFGWVWVPRGMASDWRPYSWGHWTWVPLAGWCWVPYEPWGWGPFHYGRWHWNMGWGWYWIPMYAWGPGWVDWWWNDYYYGWSPLSYWGYPCILYNNIFYGRGWRGAYPYNSRALTVVRKDQLRARNVHKNALGEDAIRNLGHIRMTGKPPDVGPGPGERLAVEPIRDGRVILKKTGEGSEPRSSPGRRTIGDQPVDKGGAKPDDARVADGRKIDQRGKGETGRVTPKSKTPPPSSGERRIRKRDAEGSGGMYGEMGYPSSPRISRDGVSGTRRSSGSLLGEIIRRYSGDSSISRGSSRSSGSSTSSGRTSSVSRGSSRSSGSSGSAGRSSSGSRGSSGRSSSSGSRSSGGGGHKK